MKTPRRSFDFRDGFLRLWLAIFKTTMVRL
nr:MAG TPA: hypothetical protein [Caudoviricetes sp.]